VELVHGPLTGSTAVDPRVHRLSLNESHQLTNQRPGLARSKGYDGFYSRASIGERTSRGDSGRGAALRSAAQPARSGGSPE
jgi:hypothetical protein